MIERKILIGLITSTDFLQQISNDWKDAYIESPTARLMAQWCWEFYNEHEKAPMRDIEFIYIDKLKKGIDTDLAEEIEEDILPSLSEEYERNENENIDILLQETRKHFTKRQLQLFGEELVVLTEKGKIKEAVKKADEFEVDTFEKPKGLDLRSSETSEKIKIAFDTTYQSLIKFPGALGKFWNDELVRGGLVALLAPEKRGKTFWLLELMMRAYKQGRKVAFFQAGDMTENQQLIRMCVYLAQKSNKEKYCGVQYIPVLDCIKNQADTCNKKIRECDYGVTDMEENQIREDVTKEKLLEWLETYPKYKTCYNCVEFKEKKWGTVWLKKVNVGSPLTSKEAIELKERFFNNTHQQIMLSTHANGDLSIGKLKGILATWRKNGFIPEVVLIDYGDLLEIEGVFDERHRQNRIWKALRGMNQKDDNLYIVPTQADAASYEQNLLTMKNFSEDKRKFAHVTAMYGINQDVKGKEKAIGIMRLNKIVVREDEFHSSDVVHVLGKLAMGRPFLDSYF